MAKPTKVAVVVPERTSFLSRFDLARLLEQLIPSIIIGAVVVFANFKVMESQIADVRKELDRATLSDQERSRTLQAQSVKLAELTTQISAFFIQQVGYNNAIDARLLYVERAKQR